MKKIKLSLIFKLFAVTVISMVFALSLKYYNYCEFYLQQFKQDLTAVIILNDGIEDIDSVINGFKENTNFKFIDFVDKNSAYSKALETSPDLANIMPNDNKTYFPDYVVINEINAVNKQQLETIKGDLVSSDTVKDVLYDDKAFSIYFKQLDIFVFFKNFFSYIILILSILFLVKAVLYTISKKYLIIMYEILYGFSSAFAGYVIICLLASLTKNNFFVLNWHLLFFILPFGAILTFLTKEANV